MGLFWVNPDESLGKETEGSDCAIYPPEIVHPIYNAILLGMHGLIAEAVLTLWCSSTSVLHQNIIVWVLAAIVPCV